MTLLQKIKKISPKLLIFIIIIAVGVAIVTYLKSNKKVIKPKVQKETSWLVETMPVKFGTYSPYQQLYGKINTEKVIKILAHGGGEIEKVFVSSGELVKTGQLLLRLDRIDFANAKEQDIAKVLQTELELEQTKIDIDNYTKLLAYDKKLLQLDKKRLERTKKLVQQRNISDAELEKAEENYVKRQATITNQEKNKQGAKLRLKRLNARLKSEQSQLDKSSRSLRNASQKSPVDGLITKVNVQTGSRVGLNSIMLEILPLNNLEITATLVNDQLPDIFKALQQKKNISAFVNAFGSSLDASLVRLQGQSDNGGAVGVFKFHNLALEQLQRLRPNMVFPLLLQRPEVADSMLVPYAAIYGSDKVYAVREGSLQAVKVKLLGSVPAVESGVDWALIRSEEIQDDDVISITHLPNATHNLPVSIKKNN